MTKHDKLAQGTFQIHEDGNDPCDHCNRPPAAHIDLGDDTRVIARTFFCEEEPVDFSHGLQTSSRELKRMIDVVRTCTSHANFHIHRTNRFTGAKDHVNSRYVLNTRGDVATAYDESMRTLVPNAEEWRMQWNQKPSSRSGPR